MNYRPFRYIAILFLAAVTLLPACSRDKIERISSPGTTADTAKASIKVSADADAAEPAIAADNEGNIFVVFVEHSGKSSADVYLQKYDKAMRPSGGTVRVSSDGSAKTWRGDPPTAAVGPDGTLYVGWTRAVTSGRGTDLVISTSRDGGQTFDAPVKVNDDTKPASHGMHSMAVGSDGRVYVAWLDERNVKTSPHMAGVTNDDRNSALPDGFEFVQAHHNNNNGNAKPTPTPQPASEEAEPNSEVFVSYSADAGKTFSSNRKVAADVCPCCKTSMLAAADGKVYVSWRQVLPGDLRHIAVAASADKGESFSERTIVSDDEWRLHACPVSGAALAYGDGKVSVSWFTAGSAGQAGLYAADSSDGGKSFGPRRLVSSTAEAGTPVLLADAKTCVFASEEGSISVSGANVHSGKIENAALPAATTLGGAIITVFVRPDGDKRSVWISAALSPA